MDIGHEIIREQQLFRKELRERVYWFIQLRWAAALGGFIGVAAVYLTGLGIPIWPLLAVVSFIAAYNSVCVWLGRRIESYRPAEVRTFEIFAHAQIILDLISLFVLIVMTGGPGSPLLIFVMFHVILAGILLSPLSCYLYAGLILLALAGVIGLQLTGHVPAWSVQAGHPFFCTGRDVPAMVISYLAFAAGILIAAFLITSVKVTLRFKGRELMKVSRELEVSNTKLTSLYEMIKEVGSYSNLQNLMNSAVRHAAQIMGVKACSIKLMDYDSNCLRFASTYGLSEDYLSKDCVSLERSAINRRIIEGSLYTIAHIDEESYFQYPEDIRREGIRSMLCLPLKGDDKILGVFCVYSGEEDYFQEADARFFSLMTDLTALAMERLNLDTAKTWFLNKAAHQIRSPLNAIQTMLGVLAGGYLGPLNNEQKQTIERCRKRLAVQQDVINDLLQLASERREGLPLAFHPVDPAEVLAVLAPLFRAQAADKGLTFEVEADEHIPDVLARDEMLDEVFSNLISNALKYTPVGGRVKVVLTRVSPEAVRFEVRDTGIGIPEADQARLFSEFFRAENAKAMAEEGTGLGLVIVKRVMDRLGGTIVVESRVGQGTNVSCLFRVAPPGKPAETQP